MLRLKRRAQAKQSWLIMGAVPPPIGGVSTFVQRFRDKLDRRGSKVSVVDARDGRGLLQLLWAAIGRPHFVVVNTMSLVGLLSGRLLFPFSKAVLVDHNHSRRVIRLMDSGRLVDRISSKLYCYILRKYDGIWIVSSHLEGNHQRIGHGVRVARINPYIRPNLSARDEIIETYSSELQDCLRRASGDEIVFTTSAFKLVQHNGRDLYGFDLALAAISRMVSAGRKVRIIIFVADAGDGSTLLRFKKQADTLGLGDVVIWETGQKLLWPVFLKADCYLRLTSTDGWSISVEEALDLGCMVIASDVTPRDERCVLFSYPELDDLVAKMSATVPRRVVD